MPNILPFKKHPNKATIPKLADIPTENDLGYPLETVATGISIAIEITNTISQYVSSFHCMRDGERLFLIRVPAGKSIIIDHIICNECTMNHVLGDDDDDEAYWEMKLI